MDEFIIRSKGFSDVIITAENEESAKRIYKDKYPENEIEEVIHNNYL